jgi:hypothetical protein
LRVEIASNRENVNELRFALFIDHRGIYIHSIGERKLSPHASTTHVRVVGEPPVRDAVFTRKSSPRTESLRSWR